jgi:hypothetical protein
MSTKKTKRPETSDEAYKSLDKEEISSTHAKILQTIKRIGCGTYEDISLASNLQPQRVWKRLSEMLENKLVYRNGDKKMLSSKRLGFVWFPYTEGSIDIVNQKKSLKQTPTISDHARALQKASRRKPNNNNVEEKLF